MGDAEGPADPDGDGDPVEGADDPGEPAADGPGDVERDPGSGDPDEPGPPDGPTDGIAIVGEGVGVDGEGDTIGDGVRVGWTGPGAYATTAATMTAPVAIPASSPRTMARRGSMAGGYQYHAPRAGCAGTG